MAEPEFELVWAKSYAKPCNQWMSVPDDLERIWCQKQRERQEKKNDKNNNISKFRLRYDLQIFLEFCVFALQLSNSSGIEIQLKWK